MIHSLLPLLQNGNTALHMCFRTATQVPAVELLVKVGNVNKLNEVQCINYTLLLYGFCVRLKLM